MVVAGLLVAPLPSVRAATDQDFDLACAVTTAAEIATSAVGLQERNTGLQVNFFYLGRLGGRDSKTYWSAVIKGKLAELREKAKSPEMYGRCVEFLTNQP